MKIKKTSKKGITILTVVTLVLVLALPAFASTYLSWQSSLPSYRNAGLVMNGYDSTGATYAQAKLISGATNAAYAFVQDGSTRITQDNPSPVMYKNNNYYSYMPYYWVPSSSDLLQLWVGNDEYRSQAVWAGGSVSFN